MREVAAFLFFLYNCKVNVSGCDITFCSGKKRDNRLLSNENNPKLLEVNIKQSPYLCLHHQADPAHFLPPWLPPLEPKCEIQFSSGQWGGAARTHRRAAAPEHWGQRRQSALPSTAASKKVPTINLAPERLQGWDILFWSTADISQSTNMQPGDIEVCVYL